MRAGFYLGLLLALSGATFAAAQTPAQPAANDKLKIVIGGQRGVGENFATEIGQGAGIFKKFWLDTEYFYVDSTGDTLQAVIARGAQIGIAAGFTGVMGPFSKGAPLRIIGSTFTGGSQLYWYVRADSPVHSLADANDKTVSYSSTGSSTHTAVQSLLKSSGVKFKPVPTGSTPATYAAVMSGQVDIGWAGAPFGVEALEKGEIRMVWKASAAPELDKQTIRVIVAHADDLKAHPDVYARFLRAYAATLDWVEKTPEGLKAYADLTKLSPAAARRALDEFMPPAATDPYRIAGLDEALDDAVAFKYTATKLTPEQVRELIQIPAK